MEIPPSSGTAPVASSNDIVENVSSLAREKINLFGTNEIEDKINNEGKEAESLRADGDDLCLEDDPHGAVTFQSKRCHPGGKTHKKRCVRKRRVTANLAGTKYEIGV